MSDMINNVLDGQAQRIAELEKQVAEQDNQLKAMACENIDANMALIKANQQLAEKDVLFQNLCIASNDIAKKLHDRDTEVGALQRASETLIKQRDSAGHDRAVAEKKLKVACEILEVVDEVNDEECWFDHHGYCQAHNLERDCHIAKARQFLKDMREENLVATRDDIGRYSVNLKPSEGEL